MGGADFFLSLSLADPKSALALFAEDCRRVGERTGFLNLPAEECRWFGLCGTSRSGKNYLQEAALLLLSLAETEKRTRDLQQRQRGVQESIRRWTWASGIY